MERHTKIVATLGPATSDLESIRGLIRAGMDVARLNFSHGDHDFHRRMAAHVLQAAREESRVVALVQDIQGPKLRVGSFPEGGIELEADDEVELRQGRGEGGPGVVYVDYDHLLEDVNPGERILLADGLIIIQIGDRHGDTVRARVVRGGTLTDSKGVAFPETDLRVPAITDKDRVDLALGRELGVDYVAASFVRTGADIREIRDLADGVPVIAKIELAAAYANFDDILSEAAGVMVARGDLGVELALERIPLVQADLLRRTNAAGLISITATEMLESMTKSPRPTRAEVTDVATAVMEGTDAVMLSAETAIGDYPQEAVGAMARICATVEAGAERNTPVSFISGGESFASAVAKAATQAAQHLGIDTVVAFTESGSTARLLSKYQTDARIIAFTPIEQTMRRMAILRGVQPHRFERREYTDIMLAAAEKFIEKERICRRGDAVVMVAGIPPNQQASTNLMKVHVIGERDRGTRSQRTARTSPEAGGGVVDE